jgi:hypothetical protein
MISWPRKFIDRLRGPIFIHFSYLLLVCRFERQPHRVFLGVRNTCSNFIYCKHVEQSAWTGDSANNQVFHGCYALSKGIPPMTATMSAITRYPRTFQVHAPTALTHAKQASSKRYPIRGSITSLIHLVIADQLSLLRFLIKFAADSKYCWASELLSLDFPVL